MTYILKKTVNGQDELPKQRKVNPHYPVDNEGRSIFLLKNEKIGPVCLPLKTGTTNWQKALGAIYLNKLEPGVLIDPAQIQTTDGFHLVPRYYSTFNFLASSKAVNHLELSQCTWDTWDKVQHDKAFTSWMNGRHPINRLLSGWNQKFDKEYHSFKEAVKICSFFFL